MAPWWKAHVLECGLWLERERESFLWGCCEEEWQKDKHPQATHYRPRIHFGDEEAGTKQDCVIFSGHKLHNQNSERCLYDSQDSDFLVPDSECMSLTWKWPPFNLCHLFSLWTFSKLTTKQKVSEKISVMLKLLPAFSSRLFCICQKREAGWEAGQEWCSPGLGSLQLGHSHCFSSHYNGYLWLQHLVSLTAQSVSSLPCFSQSPLFFAWLRNKHLAPLYWPKYVVSLPVSLKTVYSDQ